MNVSKLYAIAGVSVILSMTAAILTLLIPTPDGVDKHTFHSTMMITSMLIITHFGGALLFVLGLRGFSTELKTAYWLLVAGLIMLSLGFLQLPFVHVFEGSAWATYGFIVIPFAAGIFCIYIGIRGFAKLFGVRDILMSPWAAIGIAVVVSLLSTLIPHGTPNEPIDEYALGFSKFATVFPNLFNIWAAILCYKARQRAGSLYIPATAWLFTYLALDGLGSFAAYVIRFVQPGDNVYVNGGYIYVLYVVAGFVLLKAGIEFNKIRFGRDTVLAPEQQTFFGASRDGNESNDLAASTVITYFSGYASDGAAIEEVLDDLRKLTSIIEADKPLNEAQQHELAQIYLRLETYIAEKEPVRRMTREELRNILQTRFAPILKENPIFVRDVIGVGSTSQ